MIRRTFFRTLGGLVAGAFVSNIAAIYSPGRPWNVAIPAMQPFGLAQVAYWLRIPPELILDLTPAELGLLQGDKEPYLVNALARHVEMGLSQSEVTRYLESHQLPDRVKRDLWLRRVSQFSAEMRHTAPFHVKRLSSVLRFQNS